MSEPTGSDARRPGSAARLTLWGVGLAVAVAGTVVVLGAGTAADPPAPGAGGATGADWAAIRSTTTAGASTVTFEVAPTSSTTVRSVARPVQVRVPSVEIEVDLDPLGLDAEGKLEVPEDFSRGGWYTGGPNPGELGPAVVTAHVDSVDGPAPFFRLGEVVSGDEIVVDLADGSTETFVVDRVEQHPKDEFPTLAVYGNTDGPELRLITCGGDFDRSSRSYEHNVIVWATGAGPGGG